MKKAIITGATGLVGRAVARNLAARGVDVLCLGRKVLGQDEIARYFWKGASYLCVAMQEVATLPERLAAAAWSPDDTTAFFHFAWCGKERLADGAFPDQLDNAIYAAEAVRTAKQIGCIRFINAGTLEETFVENFLQRAHGASWPLSQTNYALAKLAARDMCKMVAYLEKIDYVHTRLSAPLAPDLSGVAYIASTLRKIVRDEAYEKPHNEQLFDIVSTDDVADAYYLIGHKGHNKSDYFIGTSSPATLNRYFVKCERLVRGEDIDPDEPLNDRHAQFFDTQALHKDTGFVPSVGFKDIIQRVLQ